ncbi:hypothetical protein [Aliivibrio sp. EL58]|uniref:hypothetical protein n=1 Tax=Aliivibrio sp. EL58 TaxID=2107582 RepID=UPI000EFB5A41|nr:hypothetical protein [Aliivibrio sp. EL58]
MTLEDILLKKLDSTLNPKLENRIIGTFLTLGSLLIGVPSVLAYSAVVSVQNGNTTFTAEISNAPDILMILLGVVFLAVAVYIFIRKQRREDLSRVQKLSTQELKDKATIKLILESFNTHELDVSIDRGHYSQFYAPALHYFYGVEGLAESSSFIIHDKQLLTFFRAFYQSFSAFCSHGFYFRQSSHADLHRFIKPHELGDWNQCEKYENSYLSDVTQFEVDYHNLIEHIKINFPDIDLNETNKVAVADYRYHNKIQN